MNTRFSIAALITAASLAATASVAQAKPAGQAASNAAPAPAHTAPAGIPGTISMEQAIAIAEKAHPGGRVKDVEMDVEWGRRVYEIEVMGADWYEYDMKIDAVTGKVLSNRRDWFD